MKIKFSGGFGIIEVVVTLGISMVAFLVISQMTISMFRSIRGVEASFDISSLSLEIMEQKTCLRFKRGAVLSIVSDIESGPLMTKTLQVFVCDESRNSIDNFPGPPGIRCKQCHAIG